MTVPTAVLDTSVLVSNQNREHLITAAYEELYRPVWSPWIIAELNRVMTWNWILNKGGLFQRNELSRRYKDMMSMLTAALTCVDPKPPWGRAWPQLTDNDDLPVWATAKYADAQFIVSENVRDFPPPDNTDKHVWDGIEYLSVASLLDRIGYEM